MSWFNKEQSQLSWKSITSSNDLEEAINVSQNCPVLLFKHSTRCSISSMALQRLENSWDKQLEIKPYYLDLIKYRSISNEIASLFEIEHQSPQVIILNKAKCIFHASHGSINLKSIKEAI